MNFNNFFNEKLDGKQIADSFFNKKTLEQGANVEKEHTSDMKMAKKIAKDHILENPNKVENAEGKTEIDSDYYKELDKIENKLKKQKTNRFEKIIKGLMKETTMSGPGGAFGPIPSGEHGGAFPANDDFYARGDARNLFGTANKQKKHKKNKKLIKNVLMPIQRRAIKSFS